MNKQEVPRPIDLCDPRDAREWERTAQARPGHAEMFDAFGRELTALEGSELTALELGSVPGFLAAYLLDILPDARLTLLDFSAPMHDLARTRLAERAERVRFIERSFKEPGWFKDLGRFNAVVTNQAVHELRNKRYVVELHLGVKWLLQAGGVYLVSDHFFGESGLPNDQLYMTVAGQREALLSAGFSEVHEVASSGSLVMHRAT